MRLVAQCFGNFLLPFALCNLINRYLFAYLLFHFFSLVLFLLSLTNQRIYQPFTKYNYFLQTRNKNDKMPKYSNCMKNISPNDCLQLLRKNFFNTLVMKQLRTFQLCPLKCFLKYIIILKKSTTFEKIFFTHKILLSSSVFVQTLQFYFLSRLGN
jgi:hypothetical protein